MKTEDLYNALSNIHTEYIEEAYNYDAKNNKQWKKWLAVAACFIMLFVLMVHLNLFNTDSTSLGLSVYATDTISNINLEDTDNRISVPISFFETKKGIKGFVLSYGEEKKGEASTFAVYNNNKNINVEPKLEELSELAPTDGKHYIFYIPADDEDAPYHINIRLNNQGVGYSINIKVDSVDNETAASIEEQYEAVLEQLICYPIKDSSIETNESGQTYVKDVYSNNTGEEPDLIYSEAIDGTKGYVYASDINLDRADSPEELLKRDKEYQKIWEKAPKGSLVIARYIPLYKSDGKTVIGQFPVTIGIKETENSVYPGLR